MAKSPPLSTTRNRPVDPVFGNELVLGNETTGPFQPWEVGGHIIPGGATVPALAITPGTTIKEAVELLSGAVARHNDWQESVLDNMLSTPPVSPTDGDRYIVKATGLGAWAGHNNDIAQYAESTTSWEFTTPDNGFALKVESDGLFYTFNGSAWVQFFTTPVGSALPSGQVWVGSVGGVAAPNAVSGDATLAASGALTIAALAVTDGKIATANKDGASGTPSMRTLGTGAAQACAGNDARLADARTPIGTALVDAKVFVGSGANVAAAVSISGDITINNAGAATVAALAITDGKVAVANKDGIAGTASMRTLGTGAQQAAPGTTKAIQDNGLTVETHTADYVVISTDNNKIFDNFGAVALVKFTLPACAVGLVTGVLNQNVNNVKVQAVGADKIYLGAGVVSSAGGYVQSTDVGANDQSSGTWIGTSKGWVPKIPVYGNWSAA